MADSSVVCGKCGTETFDGAHFCTVCGSQLTAVASSVKAGQRAPTKPFDLNLADIDQSFDALIDPGPAAAAAQPSPAEQRESFRRVAQEHVRPIREFMIELEVGDPAPERLTACLAAIDRLAASAFTLGVEGEIAPALGELAGAFQRISAMAAGARPTEEVVILKRAYEALIEQLRGDNRISGEHVARAEDSASGRMDEAEGKREQKMDNEHRPSEKRTIVEEGTRFKGTLSSSCPVDVRGRVDGEIETPALTVSASGAVHGQAKVGSVRSDGELSGEFDADTVQLSGVVRDNTVIRARSLDVKLSSERGKLQVIFGEAEQPVEAAHPEPAPEPTPTGSESTAFGAAMASSESSSSESSSTDNGVRAEAGSSEADDGGSWQRGGRRRSRGNRHSDPPPAVG
jgi:cytoskeletal protein CcmA (bactofilin family)